MSEITHSLNAIENLNIVFSYSHHKDTSIEFDVEFDVTLHSFNTHSKQKFTKPLHIEEGFEGKGFLALGP